MAIDADAATQMLVAHVDAVPPPAVVPSLAEAMQVGQGGGVGAAAQGLWVV